MSETEALLEKIKLDLEHKLSADSEERATELENRDVPIEIARITEEELAKITSKLNGNTE